MNIDTEGEFGRRVLARLRDDIVVWLTTVRPNGTPEPSPVWFIWDGETALVYSKPNQQKLRDIAHDPKVSLNFDGNGRGGDIVIMTGEARLDPSAPPANLYEAYLVKYKTWIAEIGMTPETFGASYSVAVRVTPQKLRGF